MIVQPEPTLAGNVGSRTQNRRIHAIVPIKDLARAKSRLANLLSPDERRTLVLDMLHSVLTTLLDLPRTADQAGVEADTPQSQIQNLQSKIELVWVISADPSVLAVAAALGAQPLPDATADLNAALEQARVVATGAGADAVLVVPADVPLITPADLDGLVAALQAGVDLVIGPDQTGSGTNALGLALPAAFPFQFGPGSLGRHLETARSMGLVTQVYSSPTLALDIDTAEHLLRYQQRETVGGDRRLATGERMYAGQPITCNL